VRFGLLSKAFLRDQTTTMPSGVKQGEGEMCVPIAVLDPRGVDHDGSGPGGAVVGVGIAAIATPQATIHARHRRVSSCRVGGQETSQSALV
jgi:hypothetical protein